MLTSKTPRLDLHGEEAALVYALVNEFINDNYKMGNKEIVVIHGKSTNILTKEVHKTLKENSLVKKYSERLYRMNKTLYEYHMELK